MSRPKLLINGQSSDQISIFDRGFQYGDGLFETIAVQDSNALLFDEHLNRLQKGCGALKIPFNDWNLIKEEARQLCAGSNKGILKIIVSRGEGGRGYWPSPDNSVNRSLVLYDWPIYEKGIRTQGIALRVCDTRLGLNQSLAGHKHLNRLEQVLARSEWNDESYFEGLMLDKDENVIECTMSNLFIVKDKILITPDLSESGINGIIRDQILKLAPELKLQAKIKKIQLDDVLNADELFISNSIIGVVPVSKIADTSFDSFDFAKELSDVLLERKAIAPL